MWINFLIPAIFFESNKSDPFENLSPVGNSDWQKIAFMYF